MEEEKYKRKQQYLWKMELYEKNFWDYFDIYWRSNDSTKTAFV